MHLLVRLRLPSKDIKAAVRAALTNRAWRAVADGISSHLNGTFFLHGGDVILSSFFNTVLSPTGSCLLKQKSKLMNQWHGWSLEASWPTEAIWYLKSQSSSWSSGHRTFEPKDVYLFAFSFIFALMLHLHPPRLPLFTGAAVGTPWMWTWIWFCRWWWSWPQLIFSVILIYLQILYIISNN